MTEQDRANLEKQLETITQQIAEEEVTSNGITRKISDAGADEEVFKRNFDRVHGIILQYEREIEGLNGEYILNPFSEKDIQDQAAETGRLYQGATSSEPKRIPEMVGGGLASNHAAPNETDNWVPLNRVINCILNGEDPFVFTPATLAEAYTAGASTFKSTGEIFTNHWYMLGGVTLVKVSTVVHTPFNPGGGTCSLPMYTNEADCLDNSGVWTPIPPTPESWTATISERYFITGLDNSVSMGGVISTFSGYTNTERTSKVATTTAQSFMNALIAGLQLYINQWAACFTKELDALSKNPDPDLDPTAKTNIDAMNSWITTYLLTTPIQNGVPGIDDLKNHITTRVSQISSRKSVCSTAKAKFYAERINYTVMRCDIQSGTLTRTKFLSTLRTMFPTGGNPILKAKQNEIKKMLEA